MEFGSLVISVPPHLLEAFKVARLLFRNQLHSFKLAPTAAISYFRSSCLTMVYFQLFTCWDSAYDEFCFLRKEGKFVVMIYNFKCLKDELLDFSFSPPCDLISGKGEGMAMKKTIISPPRPKGVVEILSFMIPGTQR